MNFLREIVSGKKNRRITDGFNLDLTYITPRIIAMSFPASGLEKTYRNNIDEVAKYLKRYHSSDYHVYNLSNRKYEFKKFEDRVKSYSWEDHHSPSIDMLFEICENMHKTLKENTAKVAVVHCVAGKGRTGTIICCYLLYSGRFKDPEQAMFYYKKKRFSKGGGVTQPAQIRYIKYFHQILTNRDKLYYPIAFYFESLTIDNPPKFGSSGIQAYIEIYKVTSTTNIPIGKSEIKKTIDGDQKYLELSLTGPKNKVLVGDILIKIMHSGKLKDKLVCRFAFNTVMASSEFKEKSELVFTVPDVDPDSTVKDNRFSKDFKITLNLLSICPCDHYTSFEKRNCTKCNELIQPEIKCWETVHRILLDYKITNDKESAIILFRDWEADDVDEILNENNNNEDNKQLSNGGYENEYDTFNYDEGSSDDDV